MIANIEANMEFCEICHENFPGASVSRVNCKSMVAHNLCHFCEGEWRSKMPLQENGMRIMNCPTCRGPEQDRTKESLEREVIRLNRLLADITTTTTASVMEMGEISAADEAFLERLFDGLGYNDLSFTLPSSVTVRRPRTVPRVPPRSACASGRVCQSRSQRTTRTITNLKCNRCSVVFCCLKCRTCVGCEPI